MRQQTRQDAFAGQRSLARRALGVGFRGETYRNLAYLLARFPLGIAYFTVFVTGLSLGLSLVPLLVGIPILAGVLALGGYVGTFEAWLLRRFHDSAVTHDPADPGKLSTVEYLKTIVTDPRNYLLVALALASFVIGIHLFVAITVVFTLAFTLVVAPAVYWIPGVEYDVTSVETVELGLASVDTTALVGTGIDTFPEALLASLLGVVVCLVGLHAVNLTADLLGGATERLLRVGSD
jgi:hypothetical protein